MHPIVVYSSTNGNTRAVAEYIAQKTGGKTVDAKNAQSEDLSQYDTVIVGSRVWAGSVSGHVEAFVKENAEVLSSKKTALYLCCIYNGEKGDKQCEKISEFLGIPKAVYFNKGKKVVATPGNAVDDFIASL